MHDDIARFYREGITDNNAQTREWMVQDMEKEMREKGFVPSLDNDPQYTVEFDKENQEFLFRVSVYGIKVGKDNSWRIRGVTSGKTIT